MEADQNLLDDQLRANVQNYSADLGELMPVLQVYSNLFFCMLCFCEKKSEDWNKDKCT